MVVIFGENNMPEVILMVGLPGSGKSTYISKYYKDGYVIISSDDLIQEKADELGKTYDDVFSDYIGDASKYANILLDKAIKDRKNIIIDKTNMSKKARNRVLSRIPTGYNKTAIVFNVDTEVLLNRITTRNKNGKTISINVLFDMERNYEEPTISEGFDKILKGE